MIYDCFTFYNEQEMLKLRLNELNDVVDKFVLVESTKTFTNKPKELFFRDIYRDKFEAFRDKIIHVVVDDMPDGDVVNKQQILSDDNWNREGFQRNAIMRGLTDCKDDDIILFGDVDEIPRKDRLIRYRDHNLQKSIRFHANTYYYALNYRNKQNDIVTSILMRYGNLKKTKPQDCRKSLIQEVVIESAGWHFSYMGSPEEIQKKIANFSHQEYNNEQYNTIEAIKKHIDDGIDIFDRGTMNKVVVTEYSHPEYVFKNQDYYKSIGWII